MKSKLLMNIAIGIFLSIFLAANISAVVVYADWAETGTQQESIEFGESIDFYVDIFSLNPPVYSDIKLYDSQDNLIYTFENNKETYDFYEEVYTITREIYQESGSYQVIINSEDSAGSTQSTSLSLNVQEKPIEPEIHSLSFIIRDSDTGNYIENALVEVNGNSGYTNSNGEINFKLEEGNYDWSVSKEDYISKSGNVNLDSDKTITVDLEPKEPETYDVKFVVKDSETYDALSGASVQFAGDTKTTNTAGEVSFKVEEGNYDWSVSKEGYYSKSGSDYINSDTIIDIKLVKKPVEPQTYKVMFVVKDSETQDILINSKVEFAGETRYTNSQGKAVFQVEEGSYDWNISKTNYYSKSGNEYIDSNKTLNIFLDKKPVEPETHNIEFYIEECECHNPIKDALVKVDNQQGYTDVNGEVSFELEEGNYDWSLSKPGFQSKTGIIYVDSDKRVEICLNPEEPQPEKYNLNFIVKDSETNNYIENALVKVNSDSDYTNSNGEVSFELEEGNYNWAVNKENYISKSGSVNLDSDKTITVDLNPKEPQPETYDLKFIVKDSETNSILQGSSVQVDSQSDMTNSAGEAVFNLEEDIYNWYISKTGYVPKTGSVNLDSDKTLTIYLDKQEENESITTIALDYPQGGETLSGNEEVLWTAENNLGHELLIDLSYSTNNGATWTKFAEDLENDGAYNWNTENYANDDYILKACANDVKTGERICDISSEFEIYNQDDDEEDKDRDKRYSVSEGAPTTCNPVWDCSGWSLCEDGFRTRECTDINYCDEWEVEASKPSERQACESYSLNENHQEIDNKITSYSISELGEKINIKGYSWSIIILLGILIILILIITIIILRR